MLPRPVRGSGFVCPAATGRCRRRPKERGGKRNRYPARDTIPGRALRLHPALPRRVALHGCRRRSRQTPPRAPGGQSLALHPLAFAAGPRLVGRGRNLERRTARRAADQAPAAGEEGRVDGGRSSRAGNRPDTLSWKPDLLSKKPGTLRSRPATLDESSGMVKKSSATPKKNSATLRPSATMVKKSSATPSSSAAMPKKSSAKPSSSAATPKKSSAKPSKTCGMHAKHGAMLRPSAAMLDFCPAWLSQT